MFTWVLNEGLVEVLNELYDTHTQLENTEITEKPLVLYNYQIICKVVIITDKCYYRIWKKLHSTAKVYLDSHRIPDVW